MTNNETQNTYQQDQNNNKFKNKHKKIKMISE